MDIACLIQAFCDETDGYEFYNNYSGRFMFGKKCVGIVCDDTSTVMMDLSQYLFEHGISDVRSALGTICYDNLGLQYIVYFSNVETNL